MPPATAIRPPSLAKRDRVANSSSRPPMTAAAPATTLRIANGRVHVHAAVPAPKPKYGPTKGTRPPHAPSRTISTPLALIRPTMALTSRREMSSPQLFPRTAPSETSVSDRSAFGPDPSQQEIGRAIRIDPPLREVLRQPTVGLPRQRFRRSFPEPEGDHVLDLLEHAVRPFPGKLARRLSVLSMTF